MQQTGFYRQMKLKKELFGSKPDEFSTNRDVQMSTVKYTAGTLILLC